MNFYLNWYMPFQIIWLIIAGVIMLFWFMEHDGNSAEDRLFRGRFAALYVAGIVFPHIIVVAIAVWGLVKLYKFISRTLTEALVRKEERVFDITKGYYVTVPQDRVEVTNKQKIRLFLGLDKAA